MKKKLTFFTVFLSLIFYFLIVIQGIFSFAFDFSILDEFISAKSGSFLYDNDAKKHKNDKDAILSKKSVILGDELLFTKHYRHLIDGKKVGAVVNQTSVNSAGENLKDVLKNYKSANLTALYAPEHGIDGTVKAGAYVQSKTDTSTGVIVYSIYGENREPTPAMMKDIDVMLFDLQDIGSRTYTYISTMYKCMTASRKRGIPFVVLDRPNPLSCKYTEGFTVNDEAVSFVGIDNMPMAHGMTAGELALFFNRKIGANLTVVPMKNYNRNMIWQDTGLNFVQTSPYIPSIESAFDYMATGMSENMGIGMGDYFTWSGGEGIDSVKLSTKLNALNLSGVKFFPLSKGKKGGVKLTVTDYHKYNPAKTGYYIIATANSIKPLNVKFYDEKGRPTMFYKISGDKAFGEAILAKKSPFEIEAMYRPAVEKFKMQTQQYHLYD